MTNPAYGKRTDNLLAVAFFIGIVVALQVIPAAFPPVSADVISAAAAVGYNTAVAFWTAFAWSLLAMITFAFPDWKRLRRADAVSAAEPGTETAAAGSWRPGRLVWGELLIVFLVFSLAYLPFFLARHGPYMEDVYFMTALQRMECGQLPYTDFAFLYGPLMIYPLWGWAQLFGTGMVSYFGFISLIEGLQFTILMAALQYFIPERKKRYWVFLLLLPLLFNTLLGLNYNGMRRLVPALVLVLAAYQPYNRKANIAGAAILGLHLAYSHEYAIATLVGVMAIYAADFLRGQRVAAVQAAAIFGLGSILIWAATIALVLGDSLAVYFDHVAEVVAMMSGGHAGFRFFWTANSLALFGLLTIAIAAIGRGILPGKQNDMLVGDRLLLGAALCAIVMLKSGLTRADLWHLDAGFLTLLLAFLLPLPSQAMAVMGAQRKVATGLVAVVSLTYLVGLAPTGGLYATSYIRGFIDTLSGRDTAIDAGSRLPGIEFERTVPRADIAALAEYLAAPERAGRPVLFYGRTWKVAPRVGICSEDYKLDNLMYSEFRRPEYEYLKQHPDALVVARTYDYETLYGLSEANPVSELDMTPAKLLGSWLSTVHHDSAHIERRLQDEARARLTGQYLPGTHALAARFGNFVVLAPQ